MKNARKDQMKAHERGTSSKRTIHARLARAASTSGFLSANPRVNQGGACNVSLACLPRFSQEQNRTEQNKLQLGGKFSSTASVNTGTRPHTTVRVHSSRDSVRVPLKVRALWPCCLHTVDLIDNAPAITWLSLLTSDEQRCMRCKFISETHKPCARASGDDNLLHLGPG